MKRYAWVLGLVVVLFGATIGQRAFGAHTQVPFSVEGAARFAALEAGQLNPDAADTETVASGAISIARLVTKIATTTTASVTLAAPTANKVMFKLIRMDTDGGTASLAGTNILGESAHTCTFDDVTDTMLLMSNGAASGQLWLKVASSGVTCS